MASAEARPTLQQVMLRVRDPEASIAFYKEHFGMQLLHRYDFSEWKFTVFFLVTPPADGAALPAPGTPESEAYLWTMPGTALELTWNHGTEKDSDFAGYTNGNVEPRGYGHIGFIVPEIETFCAGLEGKGVRFQKRLTDGKMKTIAFALDPDGYWVEILPHTGGTPRVSLQQAMLRIKDPKVTCPFYATNFGMSLACERHFPDMKFSLFFMTSLPLDAPGRPADPASDEAWQWICATDAVFLELTHNHGTESDETFPGYANVARDPARKEGFGHTGFIVGTPGGGELDAVCAELEKRGVAFTKRPHEGKMRGLAFAKDPDGYLIEIIQLGLTIAT